MEDELGKLYTIYIIFKADNVRTRKYTHCKELKMGDTFITFYDEVTRLYIHKDAIAILESTPES